MASLIFMDLTVPAQRYLFETRFLFTRHLLHFTGNQRQNSYHAFSFLRSACVFSKPSNTNQVLTRMPLKKRNLYSLLSLDKIHQENHQLLKKRDSSYAVMFQILKFGSRPTSLFQPCCYNGSQGLVQCRLFSSKGVDDEKCDAASEDQNNCSLQSSSDKNILDDDPVLKSLLEEIKKDFSNNAAIENTKDEAPSKNEPHPDKVALNKTQTFEYDYSVAEDIEEYDYVDESKIGQHQVQEERNLPISLDRGVSGVFELDELLKLLEHLGGQDVTSFPIPAHACYCDHMVVASARSRRHLQAIAEELQWVHKRKKSVEDPFLLVEGLNKSDWCAMDMGNIVVHVFYGSMRQYYDIEGLWTLGPQETQEPDHDPYALSAEDLFWLEAGGKPGDQSTAAGPDTSHTKP